MATIRRQLMDGIMILIGPLAIVSPSQSRADDPPAAPGRPVPFISEVMEQSLSKAASDALAIANPWERTNALVDLANTEMNLGRPESARANAAKALEAAKAVDDPMNRWRILLHAAASLAYCLGDRAAAVDPIKQARDEILASVPTERLASALRLVAETSFRSGNLDDARDTVDLMDARARAMAGGDPRIKALQDVATTRVFLGDYAGALKFALDDDADLRAARPQILLKLLTTLNSQMAELEKSGRVPTPDEYKVRRDFLLETAKVVNTPEFSDRWIDGQLVQCLAMLGDVAEASRIVGRMGDGPFGPRNSYYFGVKATSLTHLGKAYARGGQVEKARLSFRLAVEWLQRQRDLPTRRIELGLWSVAHAQAEMGDIDEAMKTLEGCTRVALRVEVLEAGADYLRKKALREFRLDVEGSGKVLRRALREAQTGLQGTDLGVDKDVLHCRIAIIRTRLGEHEAANEAFQKLTTASMKPFLVSEIAKARTRLGDREGATDWANSLADASLRSRALSGIAEACAGEYL